jgi:hypothetical protein
MYRARKERTHCGREKAFVCVLAALDPRYSGAIPESGSNLVDGAMSTG